jgi:cysteine desulfurase
MPVRGIYLDYQASAPLDPRVREAMFEAYADPGNPHAEEHAFGWAKARRVEQARVQVAALVGAEAEEVIFTSGATEANNIAVIGGALAAPNKRRRILVSAIEHKSVLEAARSCEDIGFTVEFIPVGADGRLDPTELGRRLAPDVALVSVMAVNNEIGTIQETAILGGFVRMAGAFFHVDATQAPLAVDIDLTRWHADALSLSAHKIYGPNGIGALVLSHGAPWQPRPLIYGGGQERGLRPGTLPAALCVGFGEASRLVAEAGEIERIAVVGLRDCLLHALQRSAPDLVVTCAATPRHPGSLHVRIPGVSASDLLMRLQPGVAASTGSACTSGIIGPSHVVMALGLDAEAAGECVRFSLGRFTTIEEIELAADAFGSALIRIAA